jgi:hypothetical protein
MNKQQFVQALPKMTAKHIRKITLPVLTAKQVEKALKIVGETGIKIRAGNKLDSLIFYEMWFNDGIKFAEIVPRIGESCYEVNQNRCDEFCHCKILLKRLSLLLCLRIQR